MLHGDPNFQSVQSLDKTWKCPIWSRWTIYSGRFYLRSQVLLGDFHHVTTTATTHRRNAFGASSKPGRACATLLTKVLCPGNFARVRLMMMMMMMLMMMMMVSRGNSCYAKRHLLFIFTFHVFSMKPFHFLRLLSQRKCCWTLQNEGFNSFMGLKSLLQIIDMIVYMAQLSR